jgi:hypothetical protein
MCALELICHCTPIKWVLSCVKEVEVQRCSNSWKYRGFSDIIEKATKYSRFLKGPNIQVNVGGVWRRLAVKLYSLSSDCGLGAFLFLVESKFLPNANKF